ncbi:MAG TPA: serine/threonine-protein kinase, partial [Pirellulaceae bacterium]|nr:serine/threonine-protein kinase [Pirellulaceae bacterium]
MSNSAADPFTTLPLADAERLDKVCDAFEAAWRDENGEPPRLDEFLTPLDAEMQSAALLELLPIELAYLKQRGRPISPSDYRRRFPTAAPYLEQWLADYPQTAARQLACGERFAKYTITAFVDAGGMGELYRANDAVLGREVAIKVLLRRYRWSPEALARISTEARALAALNHPHIVTVHELAEHEGVAYIAMEFLEGQTLADRLEEGPLPPDEALGIASALARALATAHEKQIIHRDLKPKNIFLTAAGPTKVLDFGLARLAEMQAEPAGSDTSPVAASGNGTATGSRLGTTGYMSPEQIHGQSVDARTDIFSFGCVLFEMLLGSPAFKRGSSAETDEATLHAPLPQPASAAGGLAESLYGVCERCLRKSPAERYASALQLTQELAEIETSHAQRRGRTLRHIEHSLLAAACILLVGLGIWWWQRSAEQARLT